MHGRIGDDVLADELVLGTTLIVILLAEMRLPAVFRPARLDVFLRDLARLSVPFGRYRVEGDLRILIA